jgi:2-aminoadipate transaminase
MPPAPLPFSDRARRTPDSPISFFIQKAIETPGLISLAAGLVDESSLPAAEVAEAVSRLMADPAAARAALQYGSTQGLPALREQVLNHVCTADGVAPAEMGLTADSVVLTTGSQQLLYLLGEVLFDPGDVVICEAPSYFVYHGVLESAGAKVYGVPMDAGGMNLDTLEDLLKRLEQSGEIARLKVIYTVDYYQNPTGLSLAADRRPKLVELAKRFSKKHRILILEDAAYRELRYDGDDLPSVKKFDLTNEHVIYASTFSKPCSPGLKTGYALMPADLVGPLCALKGNHDFGSTNLAQHILNELMASGAFTRHVETLRGVYRGKRDAMLAAMQAEFGDWPGMKWTKPAGGLYVWATFPPEVNTGRTGPLVDRALAEGVLYVPGEYGHVPDEFGHIPRNEARLSFGVCEPAQVTDGIRRLRKACRGLEGTPAPAPAKRVAVGV